MTSSGEAANADRGAMPAVRRRGEVLLVGMRVMPSASRTEVRGVYGDRLKVAVNAAPEAGKANARLLEALAMWLDVRSDQVRVESGHTGRDKVVAFSGIMEDELRNKLDTLLRGVRGKSRADGP